MPDNIFAAPVIVGWAEAQGRFWAFVSGAFMLHTLKWQGTVYGETLRLGGFAAFFAMFHWAVRAYCGTRIAMLAAALTAGFFMVRWDGSILTTYPLITWVAGIAFAAALLCGRRYVAGGHPAWCVVAALLLFFSFMNNEGVTVLFMVLSLLAAGVMRRQLSAMGEPGVAVRGRWLLAATLAACAAYALLYVAWRHFHPSSYAGHVMVFSLRPFMLALGNFSTSGNVLHDLFSSYKVGYADVHAAVGVRHAYKLGFYLAELPGSGAALASGLAVSWIAFDCTRTNDGQHRAAGAHRIAMVSGLLVAIVPILPVATIGMYQGWAVNQGIRAYSHTALAHFGWCLFLSGGLFGLLQSNRLAARSKTVLATCLAISAGLLAALASRTNDHIVDDMRTEAGRWQVLGDVLSANRAGLPVPALMIPRFANGTWYTVVSPEYWSLYAKARYGDETLIVTKPGARPPAGMATMLVDYVFDVKQRHFLGMMATMPSGENQGSRALVFIDGGDQGASQLALVYPGEGGRELRRPVTDGSYEKRDKMQIYRMDLPPVAWVRLEGMQADSNRRGIGLDLFNGRLLN